MATFKCPWPTTAKKMANGAGLRAEKDINGQWRITSPANRAFLNKFNTEAEAKDYLKNIILTNRPDLNGNTPFPVGGTPITPTTMKPNGTLSNMRDVVRGATLFAPWAVSMKSVTQALENSGFGPAFTKVYNVSQKAKGLADQAIAYTKRGAFGGKTFQDLFSDIDKRSLPFTPEEKELATLFSEAYTKPEIEKLLQMSRLDKDASELIRKLKQEHNIPYLVRLNALIDTFLMNQDDFISRKIPQLRNAILEKQLPAELLGRVEEMALKANPSIKTVDDVIATLGMSKDEIQALTAVRTFATQLDPNTKKRIYNLPAIFRHATAEDLGSGFKNGRDQFASTRKMSPALRKLAEDRAAILDDAFKQFVPGSNRELVMGVQLPVFRQFMDAGLMSGKLFKGSITGPARIYAEILDDFVEGSDILSRRVLSGHLNPHELDPAISLSKHVRNLALRDTLDKEMPGLLNEVSKLTDEGAQKIMYNYLHELQGVPSEGMQKLNSMIRTVARSFGVGIDDRVAERFIQTLTKITSTASIPFRPALVVRNYYQMSLGVPIVGPEYWFKGFKMALGEGKEQAWERAYAAQALKADVVPLYGGDTITELGTNFLPKSVKDKLPKELEKAGYAVKQATDWAFSKYRSADDLGRVVNFEAGRLRSGDALARYRKGEINFDDMLTKGKIRTFEQPIQDEFTRLVELGQDQAAATMIGKELADKVHFLYGSVNHPVGWGGVSGKLLGQFGTFPVQYASLLGQGLSQGTVADRLGFAAGHAALNIGIVAAGSELFDADLESWAFLPSLHYTGGPFAELFMNVVTMWGGSDAEKNLASRSLDMMMPSLEHPSIFVPYSYFINDWSRAYRDEDSFGRILARASGLRFLQPGQDTWVDQGFGWVGELLP